MNKFDRIWNELYPIRPKLAEIMEEHGEQSLLNYIRGIWSYHPDPVHRERLPEIASVLGDQIRRIWGDEAGDRAEQRFPEKPVVSTGDHHGILCFPLFVHSNLMFCLDALLNGHGDTRILLATGNIPLMNFTFPRGITLTEPDDKGRPTTIPMYPYKKERTWVYAAPAYDSEAVGKAADRIRKLSTQSKVTSEKAQIVQDTLNHTIGSPNILNQPDYPTQASLVNFRLWQQFFSQPPDVELRPLQLESVISDWLIRLLEDNRDLPITRLILDARWRSSAVGLFSGVPGCWDTNRRTGSFLFWGVGTRGQPISLWEEETDILSGIDPSTKEPVTFRLDPKSLISALRNKELTPGLLLTFTGLTFHFGIRCYGGFMQTDYLAGMQTGWVKLLRESGYEDEAELVSQTTTTNYLTGPSTSFIRHGNHLTGTGTFDLIRRGGLEPGELRAAAQHTVRELNTPSLPIIYRIIKGADADPDLSDIALDEAIEHGGLQDLILD